jgi:prenyltransferase beta subunit
MTYTCIAILVILGDDLSRLDRKAIVEGVAAVQRSDGSFSASIEGMHSLHNYLIKIIKKKNNNPLQVMNST